MRASTARRRGSTPNRLVQRGDLVVERIATLVETPRRAAFEHTQQHFLGQRARSIRHEIRGDLEQVQRAPGVTVDSAGEHPAKRRRHLDPSRTEPAFGVCERPFDHRFDRVLSQRLQDIDPSPRQQRVVELERRILRRRSDEDHRPVLHVGQEGILLTLVETVRLVDEDTLSSPCSARRRFASAMTSRISLTPESTAESERKQALAWAATSLPRVVFSGAGRTPEDHRMGATRLDRSPQRLAGTEDVFLPDELVEGARAHAIREGSRRIGSGVEQPCLCSRGHVYFGMAMLFSALRWPGPGSSEGSRHRAEIVVPGDVSLPAEPNRQGRAPLPTTGHPVYP